MSKITDGIHAEVGRWKNTKILALDIAILAAVLVLIFGISRLAETVSYEMNSGYSIDYLASSVEREDYAELVNRCVEAYGSRDGKKGFREFYALSDYYEAALWYQIYQEAGDTERAVIQKEKMDEAEGRLGRLAATKSRVHKQLGITE